MQLVNNPILTGFNADPSICRAGDDFYIATSTFDWYPGVQISHSRDLVNWRIIARPLDRVSQLDLRGNPNSGGVWAPCLTWADDQFWLIYTDMKRWTGVFKDSHNYLVTSPTIEGPWSEPVYLNSSGFDPSLFHDDDGRKWLVNMIWDARPNRNAFAGILLQEYDPVSNKLIGPITNIFSGTALGLVEGPHLVKRGEFYYLLTAEGGTFTTHAMTVARSKNLSGPYEVMPDNPLITSVDNPNLRLQSAGHGSFVELADGSWYLAHLCRRPKLKGRSILGRETALQKLKWDQNAWPRLYDGDPWPQDKFPAPDLNSVPWPAKPEKDDFNDSKLDLVWQSWRVPFSEVSSLSERPGFLRLYGRESIMSAFRQSLIARRQTAFHIEARTVLDFTPGDFQHSAGLVAFYSTDNFYYLFVTKTDHAERAIGIMACEKGRIYYPVEKEYPISFSGPIHLRLVIDQDRLRFWYGVDKKTANPVGWELDASILSDEHAVPCGFTGNFVGMACQDLSGQARPADFDWFEYRVLSELPEL